MTKLAIASSAGPVSRVVLDKVSNCWFGRTCQQVVLVVKLAIAGQAGFGIRVVFVIKLAIAGLAGSISRIVLAVHTTLIRLSTVAAVSTVTVGGVVCQTVSIHSSLRKFSTVTAKKHIYIILRYMIDNRRPSRYMLGCTIFSP